LYRLRFACLAAAAPVFVGGSHRQIHHLLSVGFMGRQYLR
jgi:hypothetical protein